MTQKIILFTVVILGVVMSTSTSEARYLIKHHMGTSSSIPELLQKLYGDVGRDHFHQIWKDFNSRDSTLQDDFLTSGLSTEELNQIGSDFERLGQVLAEDPMLIELFAEFEQNLDINAFLQMDQKLSSEHTWWGRIKKFLQRKMQKLAEEMGRNQKKLAAELAGGHL